LSNFPGLLHQLLLFLSIGDDDAEKLIYNTILYGIHALLANEDLSVLPAVVQELTAVITVQFIKIWKPIFEILGTIPEKLTTRTFEFLNIPLVASLEKLAAADSKNGEIIINFIVSCANQMGLCEFFERSELPLDNPELFKSVVTPILSSYRGKCENDLSFAIRWLLPIEEEIYANLDEESRFLWLNLWNFLPNCVHTGETDLEAFIAFICDRFEGHRELCRPFCKIVQVIAPRVASADRLLITLANASIDASTSSMVVPAIAAVCRVMDSALVNAFFIRLMNEKVMPMASVRDQISVACALLDVALALLPFLSRENCEIFYKILITFSKQQNHFQKKGLRSLRCFLQKHPVATAADDLMQLLAEHRDSISSSTVRYRLLLMSTLLQLPEGGKKDEMLNAFMPEFVAALKDPGAKTRQAGLTALLTIVADVVRAGVALAPLLAGITLGLASDAPGFVSSTIEALDTVVSRYYEHLSPGEVDELCLLIWKATQTSNASEIARSALSFAKTLINKLMKYTESNQLSNVLCFAVICVKKANWELSGKGRRLIERCLEEYGVEKVTRAFPSGEEKLLRGVRKEFNRDERKKKERQSKEHNKEKGGEGNVELDMRFDEEVRDLMDPRETVARRERKETVKEELEFDERGRLMLKDAPQKKSKVKAKLEADDDEEDRGNEVKEHLRRKRMKSGKVEKAVFVSETGEKFKAVRGKGDQQKGQTLPFAFAPLSSKVVNKRYRGQMKAAYKKLFKSNK
jgi:hypothetical protein